VNQLLCENRHQWTSFAFIHRRSVASSLIVCTKVETAASEESFAGQESQIVGEPSSSEKSSQPEEVSNTAYAKGAFQHDVKLN